MYEETPSYFLNYYTYLLGNKLQLTWVYDIYAEN